MKPLLIDIVISLTDCFCSYILFVCDVQKPAPGKKQPEKEVAAKKKPRQFRSKRPKDYPRRPLSAYNIFFREARAQLLADRQAQGKNAGEKIGFEKMAKTIGKHWKELPAAELESFKLSAQKDTERYRREMDAYHQDLAVKGRKERDEMLRQSQEAAGVAQVQQQPAPPQPTSVSQFLASLRAQQPAAQASISEPEAGYAGSHLLSRLGGSNVSSVSISTQLSQMLSGGSARPTNKPNTGFQQGLQGLMDTATCSNPNTFQDNNFLLGSAPQQQQQPQNQQANTGLEALLARVRANQQANQGTMASLPPSIQQQLLMNALQGGSASSLLPSATRRQAPPSSGTDPRLFPF